MLFKQITSYAIEMPAGQNGELIRLLPTEWRDTMATNAELMRFRTLAPLQQLGQGFEPPFRDFNSEFVVALEGCTYMLLCYRIDEKKISAAALKEAVENKVELIEQEENRQVRKLEREQIRDDLTTKSLPHIQPTPKRVLILIDTAAARVLIGTSSEALATDIRRTLSEYIIPAYKIETTEGEEERRPRLLVVSNCKGDARLHYEQWMRRDVVGLQLNDGAYLERNESKNIIVTGQANDADVITTALDDGYLPFQVSVGILNRMGDDVIADVVLDRFGEYNMIRISDDYSISPSDHDDKKEAAMTDLHTKMFLTANMARDVEIAIKVAFGDDLAAGLITGFIDSSDRFQSALIAANGVLSAMGFHKSDDVLWIAPREKETADQDELYQSARRFVIETQKCSISAIQRHLKIGYNNACRIVEELERWGVVSKPENNGTRMVLDTKPESVSSEMSE